MPLNADFPCAPTRATAIWLAPAVLLSAVGCGPSAAPSGSPDAAGPPVAQLQQQVIYGTDDRSEVWQVTQPDHLIARRAVGVVTPAGQLVCSDDGVTVCHPGCNPCDIKLGGAYDDTYIPEPDDENLPLCGPGEPTGGDPGEAYYGQIRVGYCSGFLVGQDLLVTSGHCVPAGSCETTAIVFNWEIAVEADGMQLTDRDTYFCKKILDAEFANDAARPDWALMRLNRPVTDRTPLCISRDGPPPIGAGLLLAGHPRGLPLKLDAAGQVRSYDANGNYFRASADAFKGNSGSPVLNLATLEVEGILSNGPDDEYEEPSVGAGCTQSRVCDDTTGCSPADLFVGVQYASRFADLIPGVECLTPGAPCTDDGDCVPAMNADPCIDHVCVGVPGASADRCQQRNLCDDADYCTVDPCDDANPGMCPAPTALQCNAADVCRVDSCDSVYGCSDAAKADCTPCAGSACVAGRCGDPAQEGFEQGLADYWTNHDGTDPIGDEGPHWFITDAQAYSGSHSLRSAPADDAMTQYAHRSVTLGSPGAVTFMAKLDSEMAVDGLLFYIDDVSQGSGGGGDVDWSVRGPYDLSAGTHELVWAFVKSAADQSGQDAVWIDDIAITGLAIDCPCSVDGDCDDGAFCSGAETCVAGSCQGATDPCAALACNEIDDRCIECAGAADCDDGDFCTGIETCVDQACVAGTDPCPGQVCLESDDSCAQCVDDGDCGGGQLCNPADSTCVQCLRDADCSDGSYCSGQESCDGGGNCQAGQDPCAGGLCDDALDSCVQCLQDADCSDGSFCSGQESCDAGGSCTAGTDPCGGGPCNDNVDRCVECLQDAHCNDGDFCNGDETCDAAGACQAGVVPCAGQRCDEGGDLCVECLQDAHCDNGDLCDGAEVCAGDGSCLAGAPMVCDDNDACNGSETCDALLGCQLGMAPACDDGLFCNGSERCDPLSGCQSGADPCAGGLCNDSLDACVACLDHADCDDGDVCNGDELCDAGSCRAGVAMACSDANVCNGVETCDPVGGCRAGVPRQCDDDDVCNGAELCHPINGCRPGPPLRCDDGNACNGHEACDPALGCFVDSPPPVCDDGLFCNGAEGCDAAIGCVDGLQPCGLAQCAEGLDACQQCLTDAHCDDDNLCNGQESCAGGVCVRAIPMVCDDADVCTGTEGCDPLRGCIAGTPLSCDDGMACNGAEGCDPVTGCEAGDDSACNPADCGDGKIDWENEQCDIGAGNSDTEPDTCRSNCRLPKCGDGVADTGEQCDDGARNGPGGVCSQECFLLAFGDGDGDGDGDGGGSGSPEADAAVGFEGSGGQDPAAADDALAPGSGDVSCGCRVGPGTRHEGEPLPLPLTLTLPLLLSLTALATRVRRRAADRRSRSRRR